MKCNHVFFQLLVILNISITNSIGQISGSIFRDYNANGKQEIITFKETGIGNVKIKAYDKLNFIIATSISDTSGKFYLKIPEGVSVRVEFEDIPSGLFPTTDNLVRFITSPMGNIHLGLNKAESFISPNALIFTNIYVQGNTQLKEFPTTSALVGVPFFNSLDTTASENVPTRFATHADIGSTWGIAFDFRKNKIYTSAFLKRHTSFGIGGISAIYETDLRTKKSKTLIKLEDLGIDVGLDNHKDLAINLENQSLDAEVFSQIGKYGIGGIDISDDGASLFVINLYDCSLYQLSLENLQVIHKIKIPTINYRTGITRPFAVKYFNNALYIGAISDASISQNADDLLAKVYKITLNDTEIKEVTAIPLNYSRGKATYSLKQSKWNPWTDNFNKLIAESNTSTCIYPQPILSDIEFDEEGIMILGFMDRTGHQIGVNQPDLNNTASYSGTASGDILRCVLRKKTQYSLESNATLGHIITEGIDNNQGPDGGEFYFQEQFIGEKNVIHEETGTGGLAVLMGTNQVLNSVHEPTDKYDTGGIKWYDNQNGKEIKGIAVFDGNQLGTFKKLNGTGDIEIANGVQPITIGCRLWIDCNENGRQDADENGLTNKKVLLYHRDTLAAMAVSDSMGMLKFSENILPFESYQIRFSLKGNKITSSSQLQLTTENASSDLIDSDALQNGEDAVINIITGNYGENVFSNGIGVQCLPKPDIRLTALCSRELAEERIYLILSSYDVSNRYIFQKSDKIEQYVTASIASEIPSNGIILNDIISNQEQKYTLRLYQQNGCYRDTLFMISDRLCEVKSTRNEVQMNIYPNPTSEWVVVSYINANADKVTFSLYDILGKLLTSKEVSAELKAVTTFDVSALQTGTYILRVQDGNKKLSSTLIKE